MLPPEIPQELHARYLPEALLGRGGYGRVVRARDRELGRPVAIKLLQVQSTDDEARQRFLREGRRTAALRHPHIVEVYEAGLANDEPYLVYEFVPGDTLATRGARARPSEALARRWAGEIAEALAAVHEAGLLHRDLKPENVLVRDDDSLVLTDFGLVRDLVDEEHLTATGTILGTPAYIPPELWLGAVPDPAGDQFSWAATLVRVLADHLVYGAQGSSQVFQRVREKGEFELPARLTQAYPALTPVLRRALRRDPRARFPDMRAFAAALEDPASVAPAHSSGTPVPGESSIGPTTPRGTPVPPGARRRTLLRTAVTFCGALAVGWLLPGAPAPAPPPPPTPAPPVAPSKPAPVGPTPEQLGATVTTHLEDLRAHLLEVVSGDRLLDEVVNSEDHPGLSQRLAVPGTAEKRAAWLASLVRWFDSPEVRARLAGPAAEFPVEASLFRHSSHTLRSLGAAYGKVYRRYVRYKAAQGLGLSGEIDDSLGESVALFHDDLEDFCRELETVPEPRPPQVDALRALALHFFDGRGRARALRAATRTVRGQPFGFHGMDVYWVLFKVLQAPVITREEVACDTMIKAVDDLLQPLLRPTTKALHRAARVHLAELAAIEELVRIRCGRPDPDPALDRLVAHLETFGGRSRRAASNLELAASRMRDGDPSPRARDLATRCEILARRFRGTSTAPPGSQEP